MSKSITSPLNYATQIPRVERPSFSSVGVEDDKLVVSATDKQVAALPKALGSDSQAFQNALLLQTLNGLSLYKEGADMAGGLNAALAIMGAVAPTNEMEALLAAQMVVTNHFAMLSWSRASGQTDMAVVQANAAMANKASRTFVMQMEALAKLRRGGEQVVRHVHVNDGGQAVIAGTFNADKGGAGE